MLVGDEFGDCDSEGDLDCPCETTEDVASDDGFHVGCSSRDDGADEGEKVAANEEPSSTEDVRKASNDEKSYTESKGVGQRHPGDIWRWANRLVDQCQRIRRHDPA